MFHFVFVQRDRLKLVNSSNPLVSMKTSLELNKTRTSCLRNRLGSKRVWQHGGPQKFFQGGGQRGHFAYPFSNCEWCNANGPSQNALPFLHRRSVAKGSRAGEDPTKFFLPVSKNMLDIVLKIWAPLRKLFVPRCPKLVTGLLHRKENSPWKHVLHSHFLKSYTGGVVFEFAKRLQTTFCHPLAAFAE